MSSTLAPRAHYDAVAAEAAARVIAGYSTSFGWACRLLDEPVRGQVRSVYALVRVADEIVDGPFADDDRARTLRLLDTLEQTTLEAVRTGYSTDLVVHAFAVAARAGRIDDALITPFFASMRADLTVTEHDDASLQEYVHGSAEVVGLMCLRLFLAGTPDPEAAYADLSPGAVRLGAAFQKVNFLRDVNADQEGLGRLYLPGTEPGTLTDADRDRLLDDIDADLDAAARAIDELPSSSRRAVRLAHDLFAELSRRLRRTPASELLTTRVRVPDVVKARLLARVLLTGGR